MFYYQTKRHVTSHAFDGCLHRVVANDNDISFFEWYPKDDLFVLTGEHEFATREKLTDEQIINLFDEVIYLGEDIHPLKKDRTLYFPYFDPRDYHSFEEAKYALDEHLYHFAMSKQDYQEWMNEITQMTF